MINGIPLDFTCGKEFSIGSTPTKIVTYTYYFKIKTIFKEFYQHHNGVNYLLFLGTDN